MITKNTHEIPPEWYQVEVVDSIDLDQLTDEEYIQMIAGMKSAGWTDDEIDFCMALGSKYDEKEDRKRIASIKPEGGITFASVVHIAKQFGFVPYDWRKAESSSASTLYPETSDNATISKNNCTKKVNTQIPEDPLSQTITALNLLFEPTDHINLVLRSFDKKDKSEPLQVVPSAGYPTLDSTIKMLEKAGSVEAVGERLPEYNPESGVWIQINPNNGRSGKAEDLTRYDYLLVECDDLDKEKQIKTLDTLGLPELYRVDSGNKSIHTIVKVNARNADEYRERKEIVFSYCKKNGLPIDESTGNPGRLSRLPGAYRGGQLQELIGLERGPKSYEEWEQSVREKTKEEKQYLNLFAQQGIRPQQSYNVEYLPSVIDGILTETQTLEIVAPSKAGKTWLMLNLAQAVVTGGKFLGYQCKQGRVLYLCPELNSDTFTYRYCKICEGLPPEQSKPIFDYNGKQVSYEGVDDLFSLTKIGSQDTHDRPPIPTTLEELDKALSIFFKYNGHFKLVIIDPVYIFLDGDENSNTDVARFLSYFEVLAEKHRCAIAFSHHTAKGNTRDRQSIDMPAGAGSFGRKPDTILTLKEANVPDLEEDKNHEFFSAFYLEQRIRDAREPFKDFFVYRDGYGVYRRVPESMTRGAEVI